MRGSGINRPFGPAPGFGSDQSNPMVLQQQQQQQMMMLQRQQFMARQQIIQREQLQKQRQIRQGEEQAGLMAAIRDLQQKTLQQQHSSQSPHGNLPAQTPHFSHHQPRGFAPPWNRPPAPVNTSSFRQNFPVPGNHVRNTQHANFTPETIHFGNNSKNTSSLTPDLNNLRYPPVNSLPSARLHGIPPLQTDSSHSSGFLPPAFSGTQQRALLQTPSRSTGPDFPPDSKNLFSVNQPPGFENSGHLSVSTLESDKLAYAPSQVEKFPEKCHSSSYIPGCQSATDVASFRSSKPPLLDGVRESSVPDLVTSASERGHQSSPSPHVSQEHFSSRPWPVIDRTQGRELGRDEGSIKPSSREAEKGDRRLADLPRNQHKNVRSDRRDRGYTGQRERSRDRDRDNVRERSPGRYRADRSVERTSDRHRSSSRNNSRYSDDRRSSSHSHSRDRERVSRHGSGPCGSGTSIDRSSSYHESRKRDRSSPDRSRPHRSSPERSRLHRSSPERSRPRRSSHERSPSGSRDGHARSRSRQVSSPPGKDSPTFRRERMSNRSRSPSTSDQAFTSQLSQYRQDLLNSESRSRVQDSPSPKEKHANGDVDDDYAIKEDELPLEVDSSSYFIRSCPADLYFTKNPITGDMEASVRMVELENKFEEDIVKRAEKVRATQITVEEPVVPQTVHNHHHHHHQHHCSGSKSSSSCEDSSSSDGEDNENDDEGSCSQIMEEWDKRKKHPYSLHPELWFNLKGQANDGALCRCSIKSKQTGIRHEIYPGEKPIEACKDESSNLSRLHHYRITMSPYTNFLTKVPTLINHDNHEYIFEGFSMFSHVKLENIPPCKLLRFNIEYTIHFIPESPPENFTIRSLNLFNRFIFTEILELLDVDWTGPAGGCQRFHFLPRFCRTLPDSGCKEVLSMNTVLSFLLKSVKPLVDASRLEEIMNCGESDWHAKVDNLRGMIVTNPAMRPSSIRVDQLDRKVTTPIARADNYDSSDEDSKTAKRAKIDSDVKQEEKKEDTESQPKYPLIIHQGYRPAQLSYAGDPVYRKAWKQYVKFRHLLNSKPKILGADKLKLKEQEEKLREIRMKKTMKREVTIELSSKGFLCTGLRADLCQHALMVPVLMSHLRFHICLDVLEEELDYRFQDRNLLQTVLAISATDSVHTCVFRRLRWLTLPRAH